MYVCVLVVEGGHWNRGVEAAVSLMNGNGSVLALFCFLLLTKLAHSGEKNTKQWRKVERTPNIAVHKPDVHCSWPQGQRCGAFWTWGLWSSLGQERPRLVIRLSNLKTET